MNGFFSLGTQANSLHHVSDLPAYVSGLRRYHVNDPAIEGELAAPSAANSILLRMLVRTRIYRESY